MYYVYKYGIIIFVAGAVISYLVWAGFQALTSDDPEDY